jgi:gluconolactonase
VPETISNLCFGGPDGRTVYITASTSLYRVRTTVRDAAAVLRERRAAVSPHSP